MKVCFENGSVRGPKRRGRRGILLTCRRSWRQPTAMVSRGADLTPGMREGGQGEDTGGRELRTEL